MAISSFWNCRACTVVAVLLFLIGASWKGLMGSSFPQFSMKYFRDLYLLGPPLPDWQVSLDQKLLGPLCPVSELHLVGYLLSCRPVVVVGCC